MTPALLWVTHPRHLPKAPKSGRTVVVDVAFAALGQWKSKTQPFIDALGDRLARYVDHHEHKEGWAYYAGDPRFLLVSNRIAHACPELITEALMKDIGHVDTIAAHHDFDGLVSAVKVLLRGEAPWKEADEDARAVDSPGRGHALSAFGAMVSDAMDEVTVTRSRSEAGAFNTRIALGLSRDGIALELSLLEELRALAREAQRAVGVAHDLVAARGAMEADGVFVVRVDKKLDNRMRRHVLVNAEERAPIGCLYEPDPKGGHWLTAATFDERLDLEDVAGFDGGRTDYRFARARDGGHDLVRALASYLHQR